MSELNTLPKLMRETAESIRSSLRNESPYWSFGAECEARVWVAAAIMLERCLEWRWDLPDGEGWYWCEELEDDAPPQRVRLRDDGAVERWTVAGWVRVAGRVCRVSDRPSRAKSEVT